MNRRHDMDRYFISTRDICFSHSSYNQRFRKYDSVSNITEYLKGTLLQEILINQPPGQITCEVIDTKELIQCEESDVEELTEVVMLLLLAISSCKERFEIFRNTERLADGLEMQPGNTVVVRHPISGEMSAKLRFKGKLRNRDGTYFGVELINGRGKGTTNGTLGDYKYFECQEDCGMFVALNKICSKKYDQQRTQNFATIPRRNISAMSSNRSIANHSLTSATSPPTSTLSQSSLSEPIIGVSQEELQRLGIYIGMEVYIFTEVHGAESQESGTIKFIGRLPNELPTGDIYVGIDLVNPVGNGRGVFNKRHLFKTKPNHAALVPLSGVLPATTCDATPPLVANGIENRISKEPFLNYGSRKFDSEPRIKRSPLTESNRFSEPYSFRNYDLSSNDRVSASDFGSRFTNQRGPPDGGPIADFDEDLPSQVDIYGSTSGNDPKKSSALHPGSSFSSAFKKTSQNPSLKTALNSSNFTDYTTLEEGSTVEVIDGIDQIGDTGLVGPVCGVIQWVGQIPDSGSDELMVGIELDEPIPGYNDGTLHGVRYFKCLPERALFTYLKNCRSDPRFASEADEPKSSQSQSNKDSFHNFGDFEASRLPGRVAPPKELSKDMVGKGKGIQGHHNSCYLDSTLFSMFAYSYCLDSIFFRKNNPSNLPQYKEVQQVLKEDVINPLRKRNFVRADKIMKLRKLLDELGSVTGLTNEEKDPEEFLQTLLNHVFKADHLLELRQGDSDHIQECYFYQIFLDRDEKMVLPSTQLLLEQSFLSSNLKFGDVPVCLILQMPRFGKDYKMYNRVRPSLYLDVTDMIERYPRSCTVCGGLAEYECKQCSTERSMQEHISSYCDQCAKICHQHPSRRKHVYKKIEVCEEYRSFIASQEDSPLIERHVLELYAVVCIETSHYVSFAKCGTKKNAKWCFFDSMADRVGEESGYNIPEVTECEQFEEWLKMDQSKLLEMDRKEMPDHMRRLLCDAYMCLYQSREMMAYS